MAVPVTERSNDITADLDRVAARSTADLVSLLHKVDQQLFHGWVSNDMPELSVPHGLDAQDIVTSVKALAARVASMCVAAASSSPPGHLLVVLSGAGTSGRIAYLCSHNFQKAIDEAIVGRTTTRISFRYLIAGGDKAIMGE